MKRSQPPTIKLLFAAVILLVAATAIFAERLPVKIYTSADGLGSSFINDMMRDSRGFMWICTRDGLSRFDGARFVNYQVGAENPAPGIETIYETRVGDYWITTTGGLFRFRPEAISIANQTGAPRPTLNAEFVNGARGDMLEDRAGNLWYGTGRNLNLLKEQDGKIVFEKVALNLPPNPNRDFLLADIAEAADGSLWVNTSWGLARRLPDGRIVFYAGETATTEGNLAMMVAADGRVWLARALQLFVIKPEPLEALADVGQMTVKLFAEVSASPAELEKEIRLPENPEEILHLTSGDFFSKYPVKRLHQTADNHVWMTTSHELIEFDGRAFHRYDAAQNLAGGLAPIMEDAAANLWLGGRNGLVRLREVNFALAEANRAEPALLKSREERLAELEKVRSRIAVDLHDDIGASLTQIAVLSEVAQTQSANDNGNGKISVPLQSISKVSNELVETMSDIIWSINPAKDHLHDLTQRMRRFASDVLSAKGIQFQFLAPNLLDGDVSIGTNLRCEVFLIFKKSVNNVVKHSNAAHTQIELEIYREDLVLRISDDGKGFQTSPPKAANEFSFDEETGGNGLSSMRRRAAEMAGELQIISASGAGTQILLRLPLEATAQTGGDALVEF